MTRKWIITSPDVDLVERLAGELRISPVTASMLVNRELADPQAAKRFLAPSLHELQDPFDHPGLRGAASFLAEAIRQGRHITVFGDYDADGICATAVLVRCLRGAGANIDYYIPHRIEDGYGLNCDALTELKERGTEVIVTVDCGVTARKEAAHAAQLGLDLVVTDHHEPLGERPEVRFLLNPHLSDCDFGYEQLAGVGVAFKLAWAIGQALSADRNVSEDYRERLAEVLPLVAVGTIADVVPLADENRVLAHFGLRMLPQTTNPGIQALLQVAGSAGKARLTPYHVAFEIAPRLNAVGRMGDARAAVQMLITDDAAEAEELALHHDKQNRLRQNTQRLVTDEAFRLAEQVLEPDRFGCIVLSSPDWHPGVVGLAASKLSEHFWRPAFVFCEDNGRARGSGRSIPGFHLFNAIKQCEDLVDDYGGHEGAAGLSLPVEQLPAFTEHMSEIARTILGATPPPPELDLEGEVKLEQLSVQVLEELEMLAPFGQGNPAPVFAARGLKVAGNPQLVGSRRNHLSFMARQGDSTLRVIAFGKADWLKELKARPGALFSLAFQPRIDHYNGTVTVELRAEDIQWEGEEVIEVRSAEVVA